MATLPELPYAEDVAYWRTSTSDPDTWMHRAKKVIEDLGGRVEAEGFGASGDRAAYMLAFTFGEERFKLVWPVLPSYAGRVADARRQAATLLYHDIKAKAISAVVLGKRAAFFSYLSLPDGRTAGEVANPELAAYFPLALKGG